MRLLASFGDHVALAKETSKFQKDGHFRTRQDAAYEDADRSGQFVDEASSLIRRSRRDSKRNISVLKERSSPNGQDAASSNANENED